ncbi:MAG TPA: mannitol dehydrogenase family protein [Aliidongia sp.]|uniref:mannitol dehydrogenase family protein n=1 Tax=Aliidongia sp. TaxID=1914230 RepID=UPI002DDD0F6D|nr:mannitol dehydrogenase family protein [Aliidongia sp.]HEV2673668.1 mannitol dehydrogenase family protein [Aliidongia sp.]
MSLRSDTLASVPSEIRRPGYDRARLTPGVVHLGIGNFHRAHQAIYLEDLVERTGLGLGITGVSLKSPGMRDKLAPQDGLYTLLVREGDVATARVVGIIGRTLVGPEDPAAVVRQIADPATRLITLTVTEKGYCLDPSTHRLDPSHPDIVADRTTPTSAIGYLLAGLKQRFTAGAKPPTVLSCDNLPSNGATLRLALIDGAALSDDRFAAWLEANLVAPSAMVDRIVPASTEADFADAERLTGLADRAALSTEPFSQWVIEQTLDRDLHGLGDVGVELVGAVEPYERMKLRLLNGAHSTIAYAGQAVGAEYVSDVVALPALRRFVAALQTEELAPTVGHFPADRLAEYSRQLMQRWDNTAVKHRTRQIAMDGSQKLPQRLLSATVERLQQGLPVERLTLAVALWVRHLSGRDDRGEPIPVNDPLAARLMPLAAADRPASQVVERLLAVRTVFPEALEASADFRTRLTDALSHLRAVGTIVALGG